MRIRILVTVLAAVVGASASAQAGLINAGFETGDLSGWTTFTTANGTLGAVGGEVVLFDTNGDGVATPSARFRVGEAIYSHPALEGGGIYQGVALGAGALAISAAVAASTPWGNWNGGLFELLFDGLVVDSHDFGHISAGSVERASLFASFDVDAGLHEIRLRMTRPWAESDSTPLQFVDDVSLDVAEPPTEHMPEPGTITLLGLGLLGLSRARRRRRSG
jgi:hypothetical protein